MNLTWKLFVAHARQQRARLALTALAMIAAIGVVLWVVSAYEAIAAQFDDQTDEFVGNYSAFVVPTNAETGLSTDLVASLQAAPGVGHANAVAQFRLPFRPIIESPQDGPPPPGIRRMGPTVVGTTATEPRYPLLEGRWLDPDSEDETVISSGITEALGLRLNDAIEFKTADGGTSRLQVVGITEQVEDVEFAMTRTKGGAPGGTNRGPASFAAYIPQRIVGRLTEEPPQINLVEIRLQPGATTQPLEQMLASTSAGAELLRPEDVRAKIASGFEAEGARKQAMFVTALSILASAFIIFTTLSMGVNERARQLAILRAVGLKRSQVASLVLVEAVVLAAVGWVGGLAGGWILLKLLANATPEMFPNGVLLGSGSVLLTGLCSLLGALLASVFPIWKATHISPLEAMAPTQKTLPRPGWYAGLVVVSLGLIGVNPALVYLLDTSETVRFLLILLIGVPSTVVGFVLLAPGVVLAVEKLFTPLLAFLLRLQAGLIRTQLSNHMWRSAGIAASLMLGLGLYTATQVWGQSMLAGFLPGRWTPDTIVHFEPGLPREAMGALRNSSEIAAETCLPIAVEHAKLADDPLESRQRDTAVRQDNVVLVGIDANLAFGGESPPFQLQFVQGEPTEALTLLRQGRHCLVPKTFLEIAGLGVGDALAIVPPQTPDTPVVYTIAGVVDMPGSNWITKTSGMRRHFVRTAGIVFAPEAQVRNDFDLPNLEFVWLEPKPGTTAQALQTELEALAKSFDVGGDASLLTYGKPSDGVKVTSLDGVRRRLQSRGGDIVAAMGWLPLVTLLVVSLGIVNTIAASVRARRWEFGILRAVGLRRWSLARLVISEVVLIGLVASILSLIFGVLTGWTCLGLVGYVSNRWFEGVETPLVIPWSSLVFGYALTFVLCFLAALWPAIASSRSEPLSLLQAGRSAA